MNIQNLDRASLKSVLLELLVERNDLLKEIIKEILNENQIIVSEEQAERRKNLEAFIREDFGKFDEVFKELA